MDFASQLPYWKQQLKGIPPVLELPTDRPRSAIQSFQGARQSLTLSPNLTKALQTLARSEGSSLFTLLLAVFKVLLYRYTGEEDLIVGSPIASGNPNETEQQNGLFVNTLVLRTDFSGNPSFRELLTRVREVTEAASAHQDLSFEKLVKELQPQQNLSHHPLFQVMFVLQENSMQSLELPGLNPRLQVESRMKKVDLTLNLQETSEGIKGYLEYNSDLFDAATISRTIAHFQTLLEGIVANPSSTISDLPILSADQKHQLLVEWNSTQTDYPKELCIHQLFEEQVERTPDAVAVVFEDQQLTYRQLNNRANQLANYLRKLGIKPDVLVAICVDRSLEMAIGIMGVLKAGGAYIPLDPAHPHERRAYKLQDSKTPVILTQQWLAETLPSSSAQVVIVDRDWELIQQESQENLVNQTTPENLAYTIYTSGSTGKPKGAMITHRGLVNHALAIASEYKLEHRTRILQFSSLSFDIIVEEIFPTWLVGAALILRTEEIISSTTAFLSFVEQQQINVLNVPTAFWHELVNGLSLSKQPLPTSVRLVVVGGEKASKSAYLTWLELVGEQVRWLNSYGPTETTVTATVYDPALAPEADKTRAEIPIGRPIANVQAYILDRHLQPVPLGVPGELHIGGAGLGRGYLNRPDLTDSKFIPNPFSEDPEARLYKTGDSARYLPDGNIEFIGRIDFQVKIRGFRIELGEIEAVLEQHPAVQQTVVLAREDVPGEKRLVAYVITNQDKAVTSSQLRSFLKEKLPDYMIPFAFLMLENLPMTPNGKVDRRALPAPEIKGVEEERVIVAPRDVLELQLVKIWEEILGIDVIGINDNFFELGGHSLLVMRLISQLNEIFGKNLPLVAVFEAPTIKQLANMMRQESSEETWRSLVAIQPQGSKPPFFCVHEIIGNAIFVARLVRYLPDQPLYGLQPRGLDGKQAPSTQVEEMATHYIQEMKTIQPNGPYYLGGYSFGGYVAYEMAQQLQAQGEKVALLALFDTPGQGYLKRVFWRWVWYQVKNVLEQGPNYVLDRVKAKLESKQIQEQLKKVKPQDSQEQLEAELSDLTQSLHLDSNNSIDHNIELVTEANFQAMDDYVLQVYQGPVTLFRASLERTTEGWELDPQMGWSNLAVNGLEIHDIPTDHIKMFNEPDIKMLAEKLKVCLDQVQANNQ